VSESDANLAIASGGIIIAFGTGTEPGAERLIEQAKVDLRNYTIIYNITEDVENALKGMLEPRYKDVVTGHADVREVFMVRRHPEVAGSYITEGVVTRGDQARVQRDGEEIIDSKVSTLRRFQEDVREVQTGFECGIVLENFTEFQQGDVIEFYHRERDN